MRGNEFLDKMELIDPAYVEAADTMPKRKNIRNKVLLKWAAMAACLCLVITGVMMLVRPYGSHKVLIWSENFRPEDYFKYNWGINAVSSEKSIADSAIYYAKERDFSDYRSQMEADGVIPVMPEHPLYNCNVRYNEDDSIYSITFSWHQRGGAYSDLSITVGYQEVEIIQDCFVIEIDEKGNIITPSVTVTERDGIEIVAEGNKRQKKTITFQNETAWYQIAGSWGDNYEAMAELLDWVWEHPINFDLFTIDKGVEITHVSLEECPDAFADYIPDFEAFGYCRGGNYLQLKDGVPFRFEGHYYSGVDKSKVDDGSYLLEEGWTEIHWCIDTEPDYYDLQECLGDICELSEQQVADVLSRKSNFSFMLNDCFVKVYCKDSKEAWTVVKSLIKNPL